LWHVSSTRLRRPFTIACAIISSVLHFICLLEVHSATSYQSVHVSQQHYILLRVIVYICMYLHLHTYTTPAHCSSETMQVENKCVHFYVFIILLQQITRHDYSTYEREIETPVQSNLIDKHDTWSNVLLYNFDKNTMDMINFLILIL
jgi:hypothetical protein